LYITPWFITSLPRVGLILLLFFLIITNILHIYRTISNKQRAAVNERYRISKGNQKQNKNTTQYVFDTSTQTNINNVNKT